MPLSDHEQRELEQIERYLAAEDPKFVNSIRNITPRSRYRRRIVLGAVGFVLGIGLLLAGVAKAIPLSIAGFVLMVLSLTWAVSSWRRIHDSPQPDEPDVVSLDRARRDQRRRTGHERGQRAPRAQRAPHGRMMQRIEERWTRRRQRPWF